MMAKWILRGVAIASVLVSYNCGRRNNNDSNNNNGNNNQAPQQVQQPVQPVQPVQPPMQAPMQQPGMQQPGMQQPPMQAPTQPGMQPMQPGMQPGGGDFIGSQLQMRQQQFAAGMNPVMPAARGTLATSGTQNYSVPLQAGHCYKIIGVGGVGVQDLDLKLYDPANTAVDQDIATDNFPVIGLQRPLCPSVAGQYRLEVVMYTGQGEYGVQVFGN